MSSLSAYHSFRTAVTTRYQYGQFTFLNPKNEETPAQLALAPFNFTYLARPTTIIPLAVVATLAVAIANQEPTPESNTYRDGLTSSDIFYASGTSYLAGLHEEALFRGWMMPCLMQWTSSPFWSNSITAATFAVAHMGNVQVPVAQLAMGWYWGWLAQRRQWTLGEGIFIHTWYDVMIFMASYNFRYKKNPTATAAALPVLWLPPLSLSF
jgi:membrane protease YdiL (CAAX protease family)